MTDEQAKAPVRVACSMRFVRPRQIAVYDGRRSDTGEHWVWLPRSTVTWEHIAGDGRRIIVTMPRWMAEDRGMKEMADAEG